MLVVAVAQQLGVLGHQGDAGAVRGAVEQRVGASSDGRGRADGAGELSDGSGDSGHVGDDVVVWCGVCLLGASTYTVGSGLVDGARGL